MSQARSYLEEFKNGKLKKLAEIEGQSVEEMLQAGSIDSVAAGICVSAECDYTTRVEPDSHRGWCEECGVASVQSCLVLAGVI